VFKDVRQCNFWAPVRDVLNKDAKVLDIGTGSGIWCLEMATEFPTAEIYGIDLSDRFPTTIKPRNCTFISGNILDGLPFDDAHFDFVFQRMLCAALTKAQWHQVCKEIYRVLKPGGYVEFFDFDGLARGGPKSEELSKMFLGTGLLRDVDMTMGAKVADTLQKGGFIVETKTYVSIPYGNSKVHGSVGRYMAENGRLAYTALETPVLRTSNWSSERYNQLLQDVYQEWENGQIYSNFYCAIGRRPE
jgi:SAM-dependent methyltransferase